MHILQMLRKSLALLLLSFPVAAHSEGPLSDNLWLSWPISLDLVLPMAVAIFIYRRGMIRRHSRSVSVASVKKEPVLVALGLLAVFLALQSPIDPLAERSFSMHQIQHLLLRTVGPMLLFLPAPQATFIAGLPSQGRRFIGKLGRNAGLRICGMIAHPISVTVLFIASAYIWQYPLYFELALRNDAVHYLMHVTMLGAGLLFWWRIFDNRASATSYGARLAMLWMATTANIALGAYLTLKGSVLYPVYDELGRLWFDGQLDELLGGLIVWILGSNMALVAFLVVIRRWGYKESRRQRPKPKASENISSMDSVLQPRSARESSSRLGFMLGLFSGGIFLAFMSVMVLYLTIW